VFDLLLGDDQSMASNVLFFVVRRIINAFITLFFLILLIFVLVHVIAPSPLALARIYAGSPHATLPELQNIIKQYNLAAPVPVQFLDYVVNIFHGQFGLDTFYKVPESNLIAEYLPITMELVIAGLIAAVVIGLFTGSIAASNRNTPVDYSVKGFYLITWSAPVFLVSFIIQLFLAYELKLLPANGMVDPVLVAPPPVTGEPYLSVLPQPLQGGLSAFISGITSFPLITSLIDGDFNYFVSLIHHIVLPAITIAVISFGVITRLTRASMIDALDKDYVRLAYMKGLSKTQVVYRTAFKNAVIPIITLIALIFGLSTGGAVVVEDIFQYHGMGYFTVQAIFNLDYIAILAITIVVGISVIAANFIADILYGVVDPRIRLE